MENTLWLVVPEGRGISTIRTTVSAFTQERKLLSIKPRWLHLRRIDDAVENLLVEHFGINELSLEDCRAEARSKVEAFENYIFFLMIYFDEGISRQRKLCLFWGKDFIVTIGSRRLFEEARKNLSLEEEPFKGGVGKALWIISSVVADKFKSVTSILEEQADEVEAKVFKEQNPELLEDISDLSYEILTLRRSLKQLRDSYRSLMTLSPGFITPENIHYMRDLLDEISILYDRAETLHEFIQNVLSVFSSLVSFRLNDIMKTLTIFVTVLEPLMFVSSYYGMNIANLPLAGTPYGVVFVSLFMAMITMSLLLFFRRKGWL
jgi:magnesium transporter